MLFFQDPTVAKRAYLKALCSPHAVFTTTSSAPSPSSSSPGAGASASAGSASVGGKYKYNMTKIRPYKGPDTAQIIQSANARNNNGHGGSVHGHGHTRGHSSRASISVGGGAAGVHARMGSVVGGGFRGGAAVSGAGSGVGGLGEGLQHITISSSVSAPHGTAFREPSPTLPNLPQQPTLNALISSSLSPDHLSSGATFADNQTQAQAQVQAPVQVPSYSSAVTHTHTSSSTGAPRIGDPGRRMVAHSLGVKHPGLSRSLSGDELSARMKDLQRDAQAMAIAE